MEMVYKVNVVEVAKLVLYALVFFIVGIACLINGNSFFMLIGAVITLAIFFIVYMIARDLTFDVNAIIFGEDGFIDNTSASSVGFVPWEAVEDVKMLYVGGRFTKPIISVKIHSEHLEHLNIVVNKHTRLNKTVGFGEVNISLQLLKESGEEVLETMEMFLEEFNNRNVLR